MSEDENTLEEKTLSTDKMEKDPRAPEINWRGWFFRGALLTVLIFGFVLWRLLPVVGNTAYLWATGLAAAIMAWTVVSYYILNR